MRKRFGERSATEVAKEAGWEITPVVQNRRGTNRLRSTTAEAYLQLGKAIMAHMHPGDPLIEKAIMFVRLAQEMDALPPSYKAVSSQNQTRVET